MVFWGCSDVVESRVEHAILDAESRRNAAFTSDSEQPRRASPWGTRGLLTTTRCDEPALPIDELSDLSIDRDEREKVKPGDLSNCLRAKLKINHPVAMLQFRSLPKYRMLDITIRKPRIAMKTSHPSTGSKKGP